jgi:catechol 2,3-dioxygenase-like lactoylglutathione lyase family enzyme
MIRHADHVTFVVRDVEAAKSFFALLGFVEDKSVVISGATFSRYMGVDDIEAEHCTLVLSGASPRFELQLLGYRHPEPLANPQLGTLRQLGFNHLCFAVDDIAAAVSQLRAAGVEVRNEMMEFHDRKLVFLVGPEEITVELAEWI